MANAGSITVRVTNPDGILDAIATLQHIRDDADHRIAVLRAQLAVGAKAAILPAAVPATPPPAELDVERLAKAVLIARSTTPAWRGNARATEPTQWDRLMAKRIIAFLSGPGAS